MLLTKGHRKILVTGAAGCIGKYMVRKLLEEGYGVHTFGHHPFPKEEIPHSLQGNISDFCGDIRSYNEIESAMKQCHAVIHLAAALRYSDKTYSYDVNVGGTEKVIQACKKGGVKRIIAYSSATALWANPSGYGFTKKKSEEILLSSGLEVTILRPTIVLGKGSKALSSLIHQVRTFPGFIPLVGRGNSLRQPILVDDLVSLSLQILWNEKSYGQAYNLGGADSIPFKDLVKAIKKELGIQKVLLPVPPFLVKAGAFLLEQFSPRPAFTVENVRNASIHEQVDIQKAQQELGFSPTPLAEALERVLREYRK